jgi:hypothetical protein
MHQNRLVIKMITAMRPIWALIVNAQSWEPATGTGICRDRPPNGIRANAIRHSVAIRVSDSLAD